MTTSSAPFEGARREPWRSEEGLEAVLARWRADGRVRHQLVADRRLPPAAEQTAPIPASVPGGVRRALAARGIERLYAHQARACDLALAGQDMVVATPTASGKSLCYNLPVLSRLAESHEARALYLFPTKALSRDQEEALRALLREVGLDHGAITYDGDTPGDARRAARERSGVILTNPDMLHAGILPHHAAWARLFANLQYVVVDELHSYRGVFGSHLANVLRRLDRIARFHGSAPTFLFASATIGNPEEHAGRMVGRPVSLVGESGAPRGPRQVLLYNPPVVNAELGIRESYLKASVRLTRDLVLAGVPTLVFGQSRNGVEVMLKYLRDRLARERIDPDVVHAYRGGYLPATRRRIEAGLRSGEIRCVVATNALELGIDIGSLQAVVCAGYPGTVAGLWQRFGRAGRRQEPSLAVLVSSSAPLDQFVAQNPQWLLGAPVEQARIDPDNVEILIQHLKCAAFELPFEEGERFGDLPVESAVEAMGFLAEHGVVYPSPDASGRTVYHWATDAYPANHVSLRSVGWDNFVIIDMARDAVLAEMDWRSTHTMLHEQAIYQHAGEQYQVERLDYDNHKAFVRHVAPDYYTTAMTHTKVRILEQDHREGEFGLGDVSVVEKVVGYKKIKFHTHENVGYGDVHLPEMQMHTTAFWWTIPEAVVQGAGAPRAAVVDALRGILHAMHTVAAVGLMIDPRDLGRTVEKAEGEGGPTFEPTLFLYDQVSGGIGLAPRLFDERASLVRRTRDRLDTCPCAHGCPACIGPEVDALMGGAPASHLHAATPGGRKGLAQSLLVALGVPACH
jgi:DEAD/DEAH box helicase domain-containing protein